MIGILHVRELFKHRMSPPQTSDLRSVIRAPLLAPENEYAAELLEDMRTNRCHTAVVDEYGGTAGIVTLRDFSKRSSAASTTRSRLSSTLPLRERSRPTDFCCWTG